METPTPDKLLTLFKGLSEELDELEEKFKEHKHQDLRERVKVLESESDHYESWLIDLEKRVKKLEGNDGD